MRKVLAFLGAFGVVSVLLATTLASPASGAIVLGATDPLGTYPRDIGDIVLWGGGDALGVNDAGTIVGRTPEDGSLLGTAFVFDPDSHSMERLGTYGDSGESSTASAVNDAGVAAGQVFLSDVNNFTHAARFSRQPTRIDLIGGLGGNFGTASDINDGGVIVGESTLAGDAATRAFVAHPATGTVDIGTLPGGTSSTAAGVDESGLVVGTSEIGGTAPCLADPTTTCPRTRAFVYDMDSQVLTDLGVLPGGTSSEATDINDTGTIVGSSLVPAGGGTFTTHPFAYDIATATFRDLGLLPGTTVGRATGVNDDDVVVGNVAPDGAWVHDPVDDGLVAAPGVERLEDISNNGMAVGTGLVPTGDDEENNPLPGFVSGSLRMQVFITPDAPTLQRAVTCSGSTVLGWAPSGDTGYATTGITYRVLRDGALIGTTPNLAFVDPGVHTGSTYSVQTVNVAGPSAPSTALPGSCATSIGGTVTSDGLPVGGIDVRVYPFGSGPVVTKTTTTADGTYAVAGLAPGSYQVRFSSPTSAYVLQWNGGVPFRSGAAPVVVDLGTTTVDADLAVPGAVSGVVTDGVAPLAGIDVRVYITGTILLAAKTKTAADGSYQVDGLAAGSYEIRFSSATGSYVVQWNGGVATRSAATPVLVTTTAPTTVNATMAAAATISGRFANAGGYPGGVDVRIYPVGSPAIAKTVTNAGGSFVVAGLPADSYRIRVSDPFGRFNGIQWLADDPIDDATILVPTIGQATIFTVAGGEVLVLDPFGP
jgi:probable HAF family extracellular repeat protein